MSLWRNFLFPAYAVQRVDYVLAHSDLVAHVEKSFIRKEVLGSDHCPHGVVINTDLFTASSASKQ